MIREGNGRGRVDGVRTPHRKGARTKKKFYGKISVIVRRRSFAVDRVSVCVPLLPVTGESRDKCDLGPRVRLPNIIRGGGRSVSDPDCDVHGDVALRGVVGVGASVVDVVRLRASRRCSPFSALTLIDSGRLNVIVFESRLLLALDEDDSFDSVREIGSGGGAGATI